MSKSKVFQWKVASAALVGVAGVALAASVFSSNAAETAPAANSGQMRVISETQYRNTMHVLFGNDIDVSVSLPPLKRVDGLAAAGASSAIITSGALDRFETSARAVAGQVVDEAHRDFLVACKPQAMNAPDTACARQFLARTGRSLFRRDLSEGELAHQIAVAEEATKRLGNFYSGLAHALQGMLVSPDFLFVYEQTRPTKAGTVELTPTAKATRLSLLLWNSYPDATLLTAAEKGDLDTKRGLAREVDRMLASPHVEASIRYFFADMLQFETFETLYKDSQIYPAFTGKVVADASEQTLRMIVDHVVSRDADYRDLFTTKKTFMSNDLGMVYRVAAAQPDQWTAYEFAPDAPRAGLLTELSFLALYSHPGRSSSTKRGRALREIFLCQRVPDPPANVDFSALEDPTMPLKTARERLAFHSSEPMCAGCHKITDPIGLGLEQFDGAGQFRTKDNGVDIDASGSLDGMKFDGAVGLGKALHDHPQLPSCLVKRLASYSVGRPVGAEDKAWIGELETQFAAADYRIKGLLREIATSDRYYTVSKQ